MYMTKQFPMEDWAPHEWIFLARGLYSHMLRDAATILGLDEKSAASDTKNAASKPASSSGLFRFGVRAGSTTASTSLATLNPVGAERAPETKLDVVTDEMHRWKRLDNFTITDFNDDDDVVNEMALLYKLRESFPLHYFVFKQVCSHLCHEGNTEQLFSLAGSLSDDNGKMDPDHLTVWTAIGGNMKVYKPSVDLILKRYMSKGLGTRDLAETV